MANELSGMLEKHSNILLWLLTKFYCSPSEQCDNKVCTKLCFVRSCFDWCLTHSYPSVENTDGTVSVEVHTTTKDAKGQVVTLTDAEERRVCGHENAKIYPGDCKIITSAAVGYFDDEAVLTPESRLWQLEDERRMGDIMACDSP